MRTRPTPRCRATGCWSAPATSAAPRPGIYTWLPLGLRVLRKSSAIIREEMDAIGAQEVHFPALLPREPYEATGRWTEYGDSIFRLKDRKGGDYLLGPTHEEMFTLLVKDLYSSYKDLPLSLYQIQTKYRDEARPRAGLLRGREFIMKDSYSFDVDDAGLDASLRSAPRRLHPDLRPARLRVRRSSRRPRARWAARVSEEFLATAASARTPSCAARLRLRRQRRGRRRSAPPAPAVRRRARRAAEDTPDTPTIETLVDAPQRWPSPATDRPWTAADTLKNVVSSLMHPDGTSEPLAIGLPGDREVDLKRLEGAAGAVEVVPMDEADFARTRRWSRATSAPQVLGEESTRGIRYLVDPRVVEGTRWVTGANEPTAGTSSTSSPAATSRPTAPSRPPRCATATRARTALEGTLESARGIEIGHIFQLGRKYAEALGLKVLDENGKLVTVTMGSYGIGVSRAVAAIAEGTHDELGLCWPREVAPADVHIVATGKDPASSRPPSSWPPSYARRASTCSTTTAEGLARREVQGRRADRRAHHRHRRPRPGRRPGRGQGPALRRAQRPPSRGGGDPSDRPGERLTDLQLCAVQLGEAAALCRCGRSRRRLVHEANGASPHTRRSPRNRPRVRAGAVREPAVPGTSREFLVADRARGPAQFRGRSRKGLDLVDPGQRRRLAPEAQFAHRGGRQPRRRPGAVGAGRAGHQVAVPGRGGPLGDQGGRPSRRPGCPARRAACTPQRPRRCRVAELGQPVGEQVASGPVEVVGRAQRIGQRARRRTAA